MIAHPFSMCCPCHQRIVIVWKQARDGAAAARGKCLHREAELEITVWYLCTRYEYLSVERKRRMSSTRDEEQVSNSAHSQFLCISIMYFLTSSWNALTVLATHFRWIAHLNFIGFFVVFVRKKVDCDDLSSRARSSTCSNHSHPTNIPSPSSVSSSNRSLGLWILRRRYQLSLSPIPPPIPILDHFSHNHHEVERCDDDLRILRFVVVVGSVCVCLCSAARHGFATPPPTPTATPVAAPAASRCPASHVQWSRRRHPRRR